MRRIKADDAIDVAQTGGDEAAAVVDDAALQLVGGLGGKDDQPAGCVHGVAVLDQRSNRGRFHTNVGQPRAVELQFKRFTSRQRDGAALGDNHAVVAHFGGQQGDEATEIRCEIAVVFNFAGGTIAREVELAGHEVGVADAVRGGGECADVDAGAAAEIYATAVGQKHLPVGVDAAEDLAGVGVQHAVEDGGAAGRLNEVHRGGAADVESVPVDGSALAGLRDGERVVDRRSDRRLPGNKLAAGRECGCHRWVWRRRKSRRWRDGDKACRREQHCTRSSFAARLDDFGDSDPGVGEVVENQAVGFIHGVTPAVFLINGGNIATIK